MDSACKRSRNGYFLFDESRPHFSKTILRQTIADGKLGLPKKFVREYGNGLPNKVFLDVPSGAVWEVGLLKKDGKIWLQNGWKEFAEHYSLAYGSLIVFEYEGDCHFHVLIFDMSALEIDYPSRMINGDEDPALEGECEEPMMEEAKDDVSVEIIDDFHPVQKTEEKSLFSCPQPHENMTNNFTSRFKRARKIQNHDGFSVAMKQENSMRKVNTRHPTRQSEARRPDFAAEKGKTSMSRRTQPLTISEKDNALRRAAAAAFKSKAPYFMVAMQPSYVHCGFRLPIPSSFALKHFKNDHDNAILHDANGRIWPVNYRIYQRNGISRAEFVGGWNKFSEDNLLEVGDVCVFALTECIEISLNVFITRANEDKSFEAANQRRSKRSLLIDIDTEIHTDDEKGMSGKPYDCANKRRRQICEENEDHVLGAMLDDISPRKKIKNSNVINPHPEMTKSPSSNAERTLKIQRLTTLTAMEKEEALCRASAFKSDNPSFFVAMQPAYVHTGGYLHIPSMFATTYFTKKQGEVILQDSEGRTWPVEYGFNLGKASFRSTWMAFASDNNLEVGDACVFELIEVTKLRFKVVTFRAKEASRRTSLGH